MQEMESISSLSECLQAPGEREELIDTEKFL